MEHQNAEFLHAIADGKTVQINTLHGIELAWRDVTPNDWVRFCTCSSSCFRIKPEAKWYRVALFNSGATFTADSEDKEKRYEMSEYFVRWLTDRIEYEA